jgi:hypothetical protein
MDMLFMQSSTGFTSGWVLAAAALTASMSTLVLKSNEMYQLLQPHNCQRAFCVLRVNILMLQSAAQRMAMKEAAPIYKSLTAEEKAQYIKLAEGGPCSPLCTLCVQEVPQAFSMLWKRAASSAQSEQR